MDPSKGIPREYRTAFQAVLLFSAPLLMGGVHPAVIIGLSWLGILFLALMTYHAQITDRHLELPWIGLALLGLAGWTALQIVPLPGLLLRLVAPGTAGLYQYMLHDLGEPAAHAWRTISLDPSATALDLVKLAGLTALIVASANTHRRPAGRESLVFLLAIAGGAVAMLAIAGIAMASPDFLGLYEPRSGWDPLVAHGPFVNPNHLAGFLGLCTFGALGFAAMPQQQQGKRAFAVTVGVLCLAGMVLSESRGAVISFVLTVPLFVVLLVRTRKGGPIGLAPALICALVIVVGASLYTSLAASIDTVSHPGAVPEDQKIKSWSAVLDQIWDNPLVGTGRGAHAVAHTRYKTLPTNRLFVRAENEPLQALADWGIPVGSAAVVAFLLLWLQIIRREMRSVDAGMAGGLTFLGLQNLVDFNLEFLGVGIPAAIVLGLMVRPRRRRTGTPGSEPAGATAGGTGPGALPLPPLPFWSRPWRQRLRHRWLLPAVLGLLAVVALPLLPVQGSDRRLDGLREAGKQKQLDQPALERLAVAALSARPADYLVPLLAARAYMPERRPRPEADPATIAHWLNKAAYLNPTAPGIHLMIARLLLATGHQGQALGEYREAIRCGGPPNALMKELAGLDRPVEELLAALPNGREEVAQLASALTKRNRWADADRAYLTLSAFPESRVVAVTMRAMIALKQGSTDEALARCRELLVLDPKGGETHLLLGKVLLQQKRWKEAAESFANATRLDPRLDSAWVHQVMALANLEEWDAVAEVLEQFRPHALRNGKSKALYHYWSAQLAMQWGNLAQAVLSLNDAVAADPASSEYPLFLAELREKIGDVRGAVTALHLAQRNGAPAVARQRLRELLARHPQEALRDAARAAGATDEEPAVDLAAPPPPAP